MGLSITASSRLWRRGCRRDWTPRTRPRRRAIFGTRTRRVSGRGGPMCSSAWPRSSVSAWPRRGPDAGDRGGDEDGGEVRGAEHRARHGGGARLSGGGGAAEGHAATVPLARAPVLSDEAWAAKWAHLARPESMSWAPQPGRQTLFVESAVFEVVYGGARGGGKTDGCWASFRVTRANTARRRGPLGAARPRGSGADHRPGAQIYSPQGAVWREAKSRFECPAAR